MGRIRKLIGSHGTDSAQEKMKEVSDLDASRKLCGTTSKAGMESRISNRGHSQRELLVAGLRWEIGDGGSHCGHPWLPRPLSFQLICKPKTLADNTRVVALLSSDSEWNKRLVGDEFSPIDAECILGIKLKGNGVSDSLVWHYENHGRFTVGSAYRVAEEQSKGAGSSMPDRSWKFIWKSKAPPKVLMFAWRCVRGIRMHYPLQLT
ncbi:UNVERIFIED_CONTAM: hypothetical protein Sradi_1594000 [Sesamum radiatum]|uniref:Reverse transcriptase zinc-binding domain-containing protein n=1 Tax=Sesamum radiatum TaxID=300843 RepID=A0AAW2U9U7_SESRA